MRVELTKEFRFEAAHHLPKTPPGHRCRELHGHGYRVELLLAGEVDPERGWLVDFDEIDRAVMPVIAKLDHRLLNSVEGLENPTSENLALFLWRQIKPLIPQLQAVTVSESLDSRCTYRGEGAA